MNLELRDIQAFIAVVEERSFTGAAVRLHTTQQQLSAQIKRFERSIGVELFVRTTRRLEPTQAGVKLLSGAHGLMDQSSRWLCEASQLGSGNSGTVTIGYTQSSGYKALPAIAAAVRAESSGIVLVTRELYATDIEDQVASRTVDLGLLRCPVGRSGTIHQLLTHEPLKLAVATTHRLARRRCISLKEATSNQLAMWPRELIPGYFDVCLEAWVAAGGLSDSVSTTSTGTALWADIAADHNVGLVVSTFETVCPPGVRLIDLKESPDIGVSISWMTTNRSPAAERVLGIARKHFGLTRQVG